MRISLFLLATLATPGLHAQSFEGEIVYQVNYTSKMQGVSNERITNAMGDRDDYYVKNGDYKNVMNGSVFQWQIYRNADNRLYNKMATNSALLWTDGAVNKDSVFNVAVVFGAARILGYSCDEVILYCRSGIQKYFFNAKFGVDSDLFTKHRFGNWAAYLSKAHALPLKFILDNPQYTVESTAVSVKPGHIDPAIFTLPKGALLAPGPEN
jgi:hypothetical protein